MDFNACYVAVPDSLGPLRHGAWETRLNRFIEATDRGVLQYAGKISAEIARAHAESEFEKYRIVQDRLFESDFDRVVKQIEVEQSSPPAPLPGASKARKTLRQ